MNSLHMYKCYPDHTKLEVRYIPVINAVQRLQKSGCKVKWIPKTWVHVKKEIVNYKLKEIKVKITALI